MTSQSLDTVAEKSALPPNDNSATQQWYTQTPEQVIAKLNVDIAKGLSTSEVEKRQEQYGLNQIVERGTKSILVLLYEQIVEPLVLVLLAAAGISALLGKAEEFVAIMAIVILNALLGVFQERRAEEAIAALKKMSQPMIRVQRDGESQSVSANELVPGDILELEAGNIIPADARVLEAHNLRVQEASLTGESYPVDKTERTLYDPKLPLGDHINMLYMGTAVAYGRSQAIVVETGMKTQLGRIADMIQSVTGEKSPLQKRMSELGKVLFAVAFAVMALSFVVGILVGQEISLVLLDSVAIAVAVVPEGLPAVVTISLALGAQRMLQRRTLIRKLPAVETLGSVTIIASDKTGTLTENRMTVRVMDVVGETVETPATIQRVSEHEPLPENPSLVLLLLGTALANDSYLQIESGKSDATPTVIGDPTEGAMIVAANHYGLNRDEIREQFPRIAEVPFSSERKRMTTIHDVKSGKLKVLDKYEKQYVAFTKGAPDGLLNICKFVFMDNEIKPMSEEWLKRIEVSNNKLASQGLRVLGLAFKPLNHHDEISDPESVEQDLVFVGLVGMIDPPRPEVREAVATAKIAGIRPVMITGDHPMTALAIAQDIGIADENSLVVAGRELAEMSDEQLKLSVDKVAVYARVSPEHKLRIVQALRSNGHIVAMTGDGVNDAPALKQADIGVAMGITGTDVSKEASDMVVTDDNFATIVYAVEEGRAIYENVRRFIKYLLASNTGELFVLLITQLIAGMGIPLTTLQILWMNLTTDGIPALALGVEVGERNAMKRAPYAPNESILGRGLGRHILLIGGTLGLTALGLAVWAFNADLKAANGAPAWNTMVFVLLTLAQMGHAFGLRSHTESVFTMNPLGNKVLLGALLGTSCLQLLAVYLPFFNNIFGTNPLTLSQLAICLVLATDVFIVVELEKFLVRRGVFK